MCKCCNLFSPNQSELLSHVSEKHTGEGVSADEIIIPLRPLSTPEPTNPHKSGDEFSVMKRKRGRPKGSTKKPSGEEELAESVVSPQEGSPPAPEEGSSLAPGSLECGQCRRKFSNPRQLRKHVCIIVLNWGEEDGDAGDESDLELERKYKEDDREKTPRRPRTQRTEKVQKISSGKEAGQVSGVKKPIISVVLTAHEAIPGATKIVPVEAGPPETGTANPEATPADLAPRRGYQEYAIQQTPYEQPMKSSSAAQEPAPPAHLAAPQAQGAALPPCGLEAAADASDLPPQAVVSEEFLLKNDPSPAEARTVPEETLDARRGASSQTQGEEVPSLPSKAGSAGANLDARGAESPPEAGQKMAAVPSEGPDPSRCLRSNPGEASDLPLVAGGGDVAPPQPDSCSPASEHRAGISAFMKILDGLQKRRMNTGLCERIRKVYGDLECEYCGKLFWYQVHFDMHVRTHTREHLYHCSQCHYSSITKNCLKRHVIQKHSNVLLKCPTDGCNYSTPDKYKLQAHLKVHTELRALEDIIRIGSRSSAGLHGRPRGPALPSAGPATFTGPSSDKRSYSCPVCEKSFSEDRLIKSHIKTNHPEVSMSTISEVLGRRVQLKGLIGKRAMKCPYCDFYFMKNGSDLQRHIWAHEGVKPFKCSLCEYATRSKSNLKAHMNRHSTEKTHLCDMCGKKFKSKGTLKSHKLLHTADGKQFKCTVCDYTAAQKPQLLRHMEQHASFKPFRCAHCHYSCNISGSLKRHYNRKHPNEEYANVGTGELAADALVQQGGLKCPVCSFVYGTKWEFNRHLKNKHGLKLVENEGDPKWEPATEAPEEPSTQYVHITEAEEDVQGTQAAVAALQDLRYTSESGDRLDPTAVNILQQIIELGTEAHDATAVASVVAMAPGTVTVVKQVTDEEPSSNHTVMIQETLQQASVELAEEHHLVVSSDDVEGIETVTVYTQGGEASEFIVYVQEAVQPVEEQAVGPQAQEL
ncbi:zinc finger protein ZFAT [Puma concolor]|uniref:Zinc finger protein ZFAT n=1 Tax=Puma concolor TaxID=9696 RepID=A0A6P6HU88_PUMCO|nr:zinc finger protein ZFAT [Puma concolor]